MNDKEFLSDLKRGREDEFFRRKEKELIEKIRRDAGRDDQTGEPTQRSKLHEPESRTPISRRPWITAIVATAALIGLVWVWLSA